MNQLTCFTCPMALKHPKTLILCFLICFFLTSFHIHMSTQSPQIYSFVTPRHQYFCFPADIVRHITKTWSPKIYQKLIQTCKHFFATKKSIVINNFYTGNWKVFNILVFNWYSILKNDQKFLLKNYKKIDLKVKNLLFAGEFFWNVDELPRSVSILVKYVHRFDISSLNLTFQRLTFDEFLFLTSSTLLVDVKLWSTDVFLDDGRLTPIGDILALMPQLQKFRL